MSYILHIDTSGDQGFVMLAHSGKLLFEEINTNTRDHAAVINLMINRLLAKADIALNDLAAVAVCGGPGSYTGLRIGLATAKGICYAADKPLLLHNKLVLLSLQLQEVIDKNYRNYGALILAREKEYFVSLYKNTGQCIIYPRHVSEQELLDILAVNTDKTLLSGLSIKSIGDIEDLGHVQMTDSENVNHYYWASYTFNEYNCNRIVNLANAEPFYLKQVYTHNQK